MACFVLFSFSLFRNYQNWEDIIFSTQVYTTAIIIAFAVGYYDCKIPIRNSLKHLFWANFKPLHHIHPPETLIKLPEVVSPYPGSIRNMCLIQQSLKTLVSRLPKVDYSFIRYCTKLLDLHRVSLTTILLTFAF